MDDQGNWFPDMESTPGDNVVRSADMTKEGIRILHILVDKVAAVFERIDSSFESIWVTCYQITLRATEKLFMKGRVNQCSNVVLF